MRFSIVAASALSLAAGVSAWSNESYVTEVVTAYTTYCPAATIITHGTEEYTVTEATTLTITNCPCTITKPVYTSTVTACTTCTTAYPVPPPPVNVTYAATPTSYAVASTHPTTTAAATFTGAANRAFAASGAGLAGLLGLAAYIL